MAIVFFTGAAGPLAKISTFAFGGTWESSDLIVVTIGLKSYTFTAGSATTNTVVTNLVTAWAALDATDYPEFAEITPSVVVAGTLTLTAATPGKPFSVTITTTETGGGAADSQTIGSETITQASCGPAHANATANYSGGALPSNGDTLVFRDTDQSLLYDLDALSAVTLAELIIDQSFTGDIGLPEYDADGDYYQYRGDYLQVGATLVTVGSGEGAGSGLIKLNLGSVQSTINVLQTGQPSQDGFKAVVIKGTNASNELNVVKGSVDVAPEQGNTSTLLTLRVAYDENLDSDADVRIGDAVTLSYVTQYGGKLEIKSDTTSVDHFDGTLKILEGAHPLIESRGGTLDYRSTGEFTLLASNAVVDFSNDPRPKQTGDVIDLYRGTTFNDPLGVVSGPGGGILSLRDNTGGLTVNRPPRSEYEWAA